MDENKRAKYEQLLQEARVEVTDIDKEVERELAAVKERLAGLQSEKDAMMTLYDGYCRLLGVENDLASEEDEEED